jgi:protein TonB
VYEGLVESARSVDRKKTAAASLVSLVVHVAIIVSAAIATVHVSRAAQTTVVDTALVFLTQPRPQPEQPAPPPPDIGAPLKGFQTLVAPIDIPADIPPVDLQEKFDPRDYSGIGVEGGVATGMTPTGPEQVYAEALVEEKPSLVTAPVLKYPELLRQAGVQGRVVVRAIIDTSGRAEPNSIKIMQSPSPGFEQPSRNWILHALFHPARVRGRAVRVLVEIPIEYRITNG